MKRVVLHSDFFIHKDVTIAYDSVWFPETVGTFRGREKFLALTGHLPQTVQFSVVNSDITLIRRRSRTGTVWFYTSTSNKRAARQKLYTKSLTRDLKLMYSRLTLVRISINL